MHYFEKVFDGQVLKWCVNGAELGGGKPTLLCLVSNETEAESCLSKLEPHCGEAQVTALILPGGILPETAVQSLVFDGRRRASSTNVNCRSRHRKAARTRRGS